jgi:hypothetical protein
VSGVNGLTAAKGLRRSVENAGGLMRISVPALGDAFGRGKLTRRARTGIEQVLARAGLEVTPGLNDPANDGWVTLRVVADAPPPAASHGPARGTVAVVAAALAFLVPVLLVLALASPDANRPGRANAETATTTAQTDTRTPRQRADDALLAGEYTEAVRWMRRADPAQVPALRRRIAGALITQARAAQRKRAYVRAIKLARRAARYGPAPSAGQIVRQSRAGLDLRREAQRRAGGAGPGRPDSERR